MACCRQNNKAAYIYASLPVVRGNGGANPVVTLIDGNEEDDAGRNLSLPRSVKRRWKDGKSVEINLLRTRPKFGDAPSTDDRDLVDRTTSRMFLSSLVLRTVGDIIKISLSRTNERDILQLNLKPRPIATVVEANGRISIPTQTGLYLFEISDVVETDDYGIQTEQFIDRPITPVIEFAKTGIDIAIQTEPWELFDFYTEAVPMLEVLLNRIMEQSLMEVMEEEELAEIRAKQAAFEEVRDAELAEVERLEELNRRRREEQKRRRQEAEYEALMRRQTAEKIAARSFIKAYLEPLLPNTFEMLAVRGFFYDDVRLELEVNLMDGIVEKALHLHSLELRGRIAVDGIIREAVRQRHTAYRELGRELIIEAMMERVVPALRTRVAVDFIERMVDFSIDRLEVAAAAWKRVLKNVTNAILDEIVNAAVEDTMSRVDGTNAAGANFMNKTRRGAGLVFCFVQRMMRALGEWISSIIDEPVTYIDESCLLKTLNKCSLCFSPSNSSTEKIKNFLNGVYRFPVHEIVCWDRLFDDCTECELVAFLIIVGGMQTQSAKYFVNAALALDDDVQFAIYAIIQGPMTQIANESRITREDILKVLQLTDHKVEHRDPFPDIEQTTPVKNAATLDHGNGANAEDEDMRSFTTSTPVSRHKQDESKKSPPRPSTLEVSESVQLMPPPSLPPPQRQHTTSNADKNRVQPPMSPLTPLKTLVESPHWNIKMRLHEAEQRARTLELEVGRVEAEREDAEAVSRELRHQLSDSLKRAQSAETEVVRLRREALQLRDQRDELVEAKAELVLQAERVKTLEERLAESQASVSHVRELENTVKEFERQLNDRDSRITLLLQKLSEMKNREMVNVEVETLRLRLKDAEARLAEELRDREALERDVRSQQSVVQQMQIDRRIAEKRSRSQQQYQHLEKIQHFGSGENAPVETSFDVSMSAITTNLAPMPSNGENLGSVFHRELESARSQIRSLEKQLQEAMAHTSETDTEVSRLRDLLAQMQTKHDTMETALVMAQEAQAAADMARRHLTDDLGTLQGRLAFEVTAAGLLTPEAIAFAEALAAALSRRNAEVDQLVEQLRAFRDVERKEVGLQASVETKSTSASIQTEAAEEEGPVQAKDKEINRLNDDLIQTSESLASATEQISRLREQLESMEEECRQERALSARAHHNCELNEREARRFHALVEHHRSATVAFVAGLERGGLIERGTSSSASFTESDVSYQLNSLCSQLLLTFGNLEDVLKENCRLKDEVCLLRQKVEKSRELKQKLRSLNENSEYLESEVHRLLRKQSLPSELRRCPHIARPIVEDAQDTEDDSVAYTDLSQVSSHLPFSLPSDSPRDDDGGVEPVAQRPHRPRVGGSGGGSMPPPPPPSSLRRPTTFEISPPSPITGRSRRQPNPLPPPPLPTHPRSARYNSMEPSTASNVTQTYPAAHSGNIRTHNAKTVPTPERPEDLFARLAELRRRNDLQPFHLRTNYPVETQVRSFFATFGCFTQAKDLRSPNELYSMLQTVHKSGLEQQQQQQHSEAATSAVSGSGVESRRDASPMPAGRSLRPKGLQSISEVLLTGASGIVGAEHLDLSSTRARPTESLLVPRGGQSTTGTASARNTSPSCTAVKKPPLAFEVELSPRQKRRTAPALIQRKTASEEGVKRSNGTTSKSTEEKAPSVAKVSSTSAADPSTSKAGKDWVNPVAVGASNSRRPLKEATGKVVALRSPLILGMFNGGGSVACAKIKSFLVGIICSDHGNICLGLKAIGGVLGLVVMYPDGTCDDINGVRALILLIGLPAAGKSYISNKIVDESSKFTCILIEFDDNIVFGQSKDFNWKSERNAIYSSIQTFITEFGSGNRSFETQGLHIRLPKETTGDLPVVVILDDNFYYRSMRKQYFLLSKACRCAYLTVSLRTPLNLCIERNAKRTPSIPSSVLDRMNERFEWPDASNYPWERHNLDLIGTESNYPIGTIEAFIDSVLQQPLIFIDMTRVKAEKEKSRAINKANPIHALDDVLRSLVNACVASLSSDLRKEFGKDFSRAKVLTLLQLKPLAGEKFVLPRVDFEAWIQAAFTKNNNKAAYVFASLPIVRTAYDRLKNDPQKTITLLNANPGTHPKLTPPPPKLSDCAGIRVNHKAKRAINARKFAPKEYRTGDTLASFIGPSSMLYGRSTKAVDLKKHLEEIDQPVERDDFWSQTDEFMARPPKPAFVPAKTGADVATQVEPWELFDFNLEVTPVLEVLVGKTVEQALLEMAEEEELQELRRRQYIQMEIRDADLAEVERLEGRNRRYREEQKRRKAQGIQAAWMRKRTADKIAARCFTKAYLEPLLPNVFEQLTQRSYFYDNVEYEVEVEFLSPMVERVLWLNQLERRARILVDGVIREAVAQRHTEWRELGRELMTQALIKLCYPIIELRVALWVIDEMVDFLVQCVFVVATAHKVVVERMVQETFEMVLDETAEWMEKQAEKSLAGGYSGLQEREVSSDKNVRSGKSSIQKVVFHKLAPAETLYLESTNKIEKNDISDCSFIKFQIWDFPGHIDFCDSNFLSDTLFSDSGAIVFVIDAQDDYMSALHRLTSTVEYAYKKNPKIKYEVFIHKVDCLLDDQKIEIQRDIAQRVNNIIDDIVASHNPVNCNSSNVTIGFHLTTIYDHSVFEAFSKVVQKLIPYLDAFEDLLNIFISSSMLDKAFLFDVATKIYLATDSTLVDIQTYELCCDMIDVVTNISSIYTPSSELSDPPFSEQTSSTIVLNNATVIYLRGINRYMALVCILREESLEKIGIIEYNYQVVKDGIQRMLSVNQQAIKSQRSSIYLTDPSNEMSEGNGDNVASSNSNNNSNNVEDPVV
ncbi:Ras-related GTP-binding protein D [Echinococcus granulosus]|uniref:Ras-related GTP-binding protein D n=1 Tax=Echinococcus granulosus TaxID=6210 RepID=W6UDU0_ECHGR|nr:Ras-related GTP-binding protein D [Echinococcus granulosus]EUB59530.1 Ras-related GTP-binding protein D [Echinococcus granulosus]